MKEEFSQCGNLWNFLPPLNSVKLRKLFRKNSVKSTHFGRNFKMCDIFYVKSISMNSKRRHFDLFELQKFEFWDILPFIRTKLTKMRIFNISKTHKMAVLYLLPKLISHKFRMTEKFLNFHTVFLWSHHIWDWISLKNDKFWCLVLLACLKFFLQISIWQKTNFFWWKNLVVIL